MSRERREDRVGALVADGRYRLERPLGAGGMGEVYVATDTRDATEVALKLLNPRFGREERHLRRFMREAEVTSRLNHPHVVVARDAGVDGDGTPYLAMELVAGSSLSAYMRERGGELLDASLVVSIARQITSALIAASEIGVIHRDLKPGNVMVREVPGGLRVKVLDFGLARFISSPTYQTLTLTGQVLGTPAYMAREQAFGERVDARADIYGVGAIMHALLTGEPPYGRGPEVLARLLAGERTPLTHARPDLAPIARVVERCLAPAPEDRYPSATALDQALAALEPVTTVSDWARPSHLHTLALEPDPVLDAAPAASSAPAVSAASAPAVPAASVPAASVPAATQPKTQSLPNRHRRRRWLLVAAAAVSFLVGVAVVMLVLGRDPRPREITDRPDPPTAPPVVVPIAMEDGHTDLPDTAVVEATDAAIDVAAVGPRAHAGPLETHQAARACRGETEAHAMVEGRGEFFSRLFRDRFFGAVREINTQCYSTRSVETSSTVTFHVSSTLRMQRLRFSDRGRLSATESACVLRAIRRRVVDFGEARFGGLSFELANENVRLELDHQPLCAP